MTLNIDGSNTEKIEKTVEGLPHANHTVQEALNELLIFLMDLNHIDIQTHPKTYYLYLQKTLNNSIEVTEQLNTLIELLQVELLQKNDQINGQIPSPLLNDEFVDNFIREMNKGYFEQIKNKQS